MTHYRHCIFFLADGARPDVMEELMAAGDLPNIQRYLVEQGGYRPATTVFPSTTGPAHLPYLTGRFPGHCNVPGIRWFDREKYHGTIFSTERFRSYVGLESFLINRDLDRMYLTLFELAKSPVNILSSVNRGATFSGNKTKLARILYFYYAHITDHWSFVDATALRKLLAAIDEKSDFYFVLMPGIDEYTHLSHPHSPEVIKAYRFLDYTIGQTMQRLRELGMQDETLIMIGSDHGLTQTNVHFGLGSFIESQGHKTFYYPLIYKLKFDVVSMVSGNSMAHLYVKSDGSWQRRTCHEDISKSAGALLDELLSREEVDIIMTRSCEGDIVVTSKRGTARIREVEGGVKYSCNGSDPFGFEDLNLPDTMTYSESLKFTFNTDYPDAIVQILQLFHSPRCGDIVLSATPGFDLRMKFEHPEHKASHGSLYKDHMLVPFIANTKLEDRPTRTVDVFPTILRLMKWSHPHRVDGISLNPLG